jgi:hypothetical protein
MQTIFNAIGSVLGATFIVFVLMLILGLPTMFLWNWLMSVIFKLPEINFIQAIGLMLLAYFIFPSSSKTTKSK